MTVNHDQSLADDPREERRGWHLDKRISVEGLIAIAASMTAILTVYHSMDIRTTNNERDIVAVTANNVRIERKLDDTRLELNSKLDKTNDKLDRVIEQHMVAASNGHDDRRYSGRGGSQ